MKQENTDEWRSVLESEILEEVSFSENSLVRILFISSLATALASFGLLGYFIRPSDMLYVLHYNVYFGVEIQGIWWQAYILPTVGIVFLTGHLFLAKKFYQSAERIASYLLMFGSVLIGSGVLIASVSAAYINY